MRVCKYCKKEKDDSEFYYNKFGKLSTRRCKKCKIKQTTAIKNSKNPNKKEYKTKLLLLQEEAENKQLRQDVLQALFPKGFIPEKFRKRYL